MTLLTEDMEQEDRWPSYAVVAAECGAHGSVSVGLPIQQAVTGALNVYAREPHALDDDAIEPAETFAGYAAVALANVHLYESTAALAGQMQEAMTSRADIEQAKGILVAQRHCSPEGPRPGAQLTAPFGAAVHPHTKSRATAGSESDVKRRVALG